MSENVCPCCGRHCNVDDLHCDRGREYARTGVIPERKDHEGRHHEGKHHHRKDLKDMNETMKLVHNFREICHVIHHHSQGKGSQQRILIILNETNEISQKDLTERLGIQPGSASEVLSKLENASLIQRQSNEEDRRTAMISLTEKGKEEAKMALKNRNNLYEEMFTCLNSEEKEQLLSLLEKINADWREKYHSKHHERKRV
ncbi:MAG: MarR family winged helix-turn-helix transcriptional regulator [Traorella sp.]